LTSYRQILKSTSLIGGSSLINIGISMVRTKFVAVLLGPSGVGLMGIFSSIAGIVRTVAGMGISTSGVHQVAEAFGTGNEELFARTIKTLRRTVWFTGSVGMLFMILGSVYLSRFSFGTFDYAIPIALLGVTILMGDIAAGQSCILQGTRRISDMARVSIVGALNSTIISIPCFYFWGEKGIVPSLILVSAASLATAWWYAHKVPVKPVTMSWRESRVDAVHMLRFGIPLMLANLVMTLTDYLIRMLLIRHVGLEGVGMWQAAFNLSGILVNFVLNAMGADYYPRLTAVAHDYRLVSEAVNAQTEIALLLAVPGLAATIIFAPVVIAVFYSGRFDAATGILRWSVYGIFGQVVSWPLGFIMLSKGKGKTFLGSEIFVGVFYVTAVWFCAKWWGLPGTGLAFFLLYVAYTAVVYVIGYLISHTTWSRANWVHILGFGGVLVVVGLVSELMKNPWYQYPINLTLLLMVSVYCLRRLSQKSGISIHDFLAKVGVKRNVP
jgi:PST family polysaccharide transporter